MNDDATAYDPSQVTLYAIYDHPSDHPGGYVVREWVFIEGASQPGDGHRVTTIEEARALVPPDSIRVSGSETDEPDIVEVWLGPATVRAA